MKQILKKAISNFGYELVKSNDPERPLGNFWTDWFKHLTEEISQSYLVNRKNLALVTKWLDEESYAKSLWGYGVPKGYFEGKYRYSLNKNPDELTYSDLMLAVGRILTDPNYLEIGVSAGKNFFQMYMGLQNAHVFGMDIEEMSPALSSSLKDKRLLWKSGDHPFKNKNGDEVKKTYTCHQFKVATNTNAVFYLSGDKFNRSVWEILRERPFNIVFSDAFHKPDSIKDEFEIMKAFNMIDKNNFLMVWDDLEGVEMQQAFFSISDELANVYYAKQKSMFRLYDIYGTYAGVHRIGVFASFSDPMLSVLWDKKVPVMIEMEAARSDS